MIPINPPPKKSKQGEIDSKLGCLQQLEQDNPKGLAKDGYKDLFHGADHHENFLMKTNRRIPLNERAITM